MLGIFTNKSWIKESETLYLILISFIYGIFHKSSQFKVSLKTLQRDNIFRRFLNRKWVSLLDKIIKEYLKNKHHLFEKDLNLVPFIRAFPAFTKT